MKIQGQQVNVTAIARGIFDLFEEDDLAVMAFGMIPARFMQSLETSLIKWFNDEAARQCREICNRDYLTDREFDGAKVADAAKRAAFVREAMHAVAVELYQIAPMVV